jgi:hypothetical protein
MPRHTTGGRRGLNLAKKCHVIFEWTQTALHLLRGEGSDKSVTKHFLFPKDLKSKQM